MRASLNVRAAAPSVLILVGIVTVWYFATMTVKGSAGTAGMTAEQIEYQKMMGKDATSTKTTGFPTPMDIGATIVKQLRIRSTTGVRTTRASRCSSRIGSVGSCSASGSRWSSRSRWYELVNVYGTTIKELIHEEFGDGIMTAIDFSMDIRREPDPKGDRVHVVLSGKFLPYKTY